MASERDVFLAQIAPQQTAAERAIHDGDPEPRVRMWSQTSAVTLYGADLTATGWDQIEPSFRTVAGWFADCTSFDFEIVAAGASGDLAYTVGYEHSTGTVLGSPRTYTLRVTHIYRREEGQWRIVHRHGDYPPEARRQAD